MNTFTLNPNSHMALAYAVPFNGAIRYEVDSERPTWTFVMDERNLAEFKAGRQYQWFGGQSNVTEHRWNQELFFRGTWYLVIVNYNTMLPTAVHYNVWSS